MNKSHLIFLDTETTGIGPDDRLCQVAYKFQDAENEALFKPPVPISIDAMAVAHITNKMVADKELFLDSAMHKKLAEIFSGDHILVAHNAGFDAEMLKREKLEPKNLIDTFKLAQYLDASGEIPKYALQYLRYYHDLEVPNAQAHDALGDIRVLERLFDFYFEKMLTGGKDEAIIIQEMLDVSARPVLVKKFNFGKYIGMSVADVAGKDRNYLQWLLNEKVRARDQEENNDENWIYTLEHYLG
ncbi:MAG: exonuclease domain-containing protein [Candidatus Moranbacteria bacterium]|nr:exonuclease domain-containing protein [Candidatus Moranbacteria bacterium]